jgi:hypothetical protein
LRKAGIVDFERAGTWKVYRLKHSGGRYLQLNLKCLAECVKIDPIFTADLARLEKVLKRSESPICAEMTKAAAQRPKRVSAMKKGHQ